MVKVKAGRDWPDSLLVQIPMCLRAFPLTPDFAVAIARTVAKQPASGAGIDGDEPANVIATSG
jgi:hypothetical protein